jgi:hypothetical protein
LLSPATIIDDFAGDPDVSQAVPPRHRALVALMFAAVALAGPLGAQSISPPVIEYREKANGSFTVTNESLFPLTVVLQPRGFRVTEEGEVLIEPLDSTRIRLSISALSFRLQARQTYTVFYEAKADSVPAWFTIWAAITGARTASGVNVRVELPHVVYLNQKQRLAETDVRILGARWFRQQQKIVVEVENSSSRLGRAQEVAVTAEGVPAVRGAPFPAFPGSRRRATLPWTSEKAPAKLEVKFDGFRLETTDIAMDDTPAPAPTAPPDSAPAAPSDSTPRP